MSISEKIKANSNKIDQNKAQYDVYRQIGKISASSSGDCDKYEFLTDEDVLPEKGSLEKTVTIKRLNIHL